MTTTPYYQSIFGAIDNDDVDGVCYWINRGAINKYCVITGGPLDYSVWKNKPEAVRVILEAGGKPQGVVNILQQAVNTPNDDITILELLFKHGHRQFDKYVNLIHMVIFNNYTKKLEFLLSNFELDIDGAEIIGHTGLYYAIQNNNADNVILLLRHGANPDLMVKYNVVKNKTMPIIEYAKKYHPAMFKIIVQNRLTLTKRASHIR